MESNTRLNTLCISLYQYINIRERVEYIDSLQRFLNEDRFLDRYLNISKSNIRHRTLAS